MIDDIFDIPDDEPLPVDEAELYPYLVGLNEAQLGAVEAMEGAVLILAGAGTGKTRALTTRLAHILVTDRAEHWQVLAVTFTNKAAIEMRERIGEMLGVAVDGWWLGTFHALATRILRRHAEIVGLNSNFTILDTDDQIRLLKQVIEPYNIDIKKFPLRQILGIIDRWKDKGLTADKVSKNDDGAGFVDGKIMGIYKDYQARLLILNACDFGDLLNHNLAIFQKEPEILAKYQRQFKYIMVDEYQDTNIAQYLWLRLLAQGHKNICCVGDDDQSIYGWRGAEVGNILRFEKDFEGAEIHRLEQNYRSTGHILGAAAGLIKYNDGRHDKTLWTAAEDGEKVAVRCYYDGAEEAREIGGLIENAMSKGVSLNEIAVLVRTGAQTREFEECFLRLGLAYKVIGGLRFYERREIRDALAYLRVVAQPDDGLAFERIINVPKRGIGAATVQKIHIAARAMGVSLPVAAAELVETDEIRGKARGAIKALLQKFEEWRGKVDALHHSELMALILAESGYTEMWRKDKTPQAPGRVENLKELISAMGDGYDDLAEFLEHVSLVMDAERIGGGEMISVMSLHAAKGLEYDLVFLPGWEEGLFPHQRHLDEAGLKGLEEERRLAYVGITRAKKKAWISHASSRMIHGQWQNPMPSRFLAELPDEHVDFGVDAVPKPKGVEAWRAKMEEGASGNQTDGWGSSPLRKKRDSGKVFNLDDRVFHDKFGYGIVQASDGNKLEVLFEHGGVKRLMASFVRMADDA